MLLAGPNGDTISPQGIGLIQGFEKPANLNPLSYWSMILPALGETHDGRYFEIWAALSEETSINARD